MSTPRLCTLAQPHSRYVECFLFPMLYRSACMHRLYMDLAKGSLLYLTCWLRTWLEGRRA